ncbi:MAG TPA: hypothetical protein DIU35_05865 [Candidatus Latescibacteria bacterium]|nr:hypothetical protein [Candidatus Latescibacterota bacterium]|tara:strand:- start:906 stop:2453 length:1548 start_codon:yes stop_codon:yes gene_type:complete
MPVHGESVQLGPWTGGVNYAVPAEDLGPNEVFQMENCRIGVGGEVLKRRGSTPFNSSALVAGQTITSIGEHRFSASSTKDFATCGTKFFEGNGSGSYTDRTGSLTITGGDNNTWVFANGKGTLFGHNGVSGDSLIKWASAGGNIAAWDVDSRFTTAKTVEFWDNRAWAGNLSSGVDRVWYSNLADIETFGANNFFQLGEDVTAVKRFGNALAMHTENSIHLLLPTGNASVPYRRVQRANAGTIARRAIQTVQIPEFGEVQIFVRRDGVYLFNGDSTQKVSWKLDGERFWDDLNQAQLDECFSIQYPKRNEIWFWVPNGSALQTEFNQAIVYDYIRQIWYGPFTDTNRNCAGIISRQLYAGGYDNGIVYNQDVGLHDDASGSADTAIAAFFDTAAASPRNIEQVERWRYLRSAYDVQFGGNYNLNITYFASGIVGELTTVSQSGDFDQIEIDFRIATSTIAGEGSLASEDITLSGYDPSIRVRYQNSSLDEDFKLRRAVAVYTPLGRRRKPKSGVY